MKSAHVLSVLTLGLVLATGCESDLLAPPTGGDELSLPVASGRSNRGKGPKVKDPKPDPEPDPQPDPDPAPDPGKGTYELAVADDFDPLWRYSRSGNQVLLQTDPSVTSWGTDYWGYWSDPFPAQGDVVEYTIGLTHTTYTFTALEDGSVDVSKTLVVQPYLGGEPTTTVTHVGIFAPVG